MKISLKSLSAEVNLKAYTYAQYNGKTVKNFKKKDSTTYKLIPGAFFAYREGTTKVYFVFPGMLETEFAMSYETVEKLFDESDEPKEKRTELTKFFKSGTAGLLKNLTEKVTKPKAEKPTSKPVSKPVEKPVEIESEIPEAPPVKKSLKDKYAKAAPLDLTPTTPRVTDQFHRTPPKNPEEHQAVLTFKNYFRPAEFDRANTDVEQRKYLYMQWKKLNEEKFGGRMRPPIMHIFTKDQLQLAGHYDSGKRELGINPRLFLRAEFVVLMTLLHEMCHQYVREVLRSRDNSDGGHGPEWQDIMKKVGLMPSRYNKSGDYMLSEDEQDEKDQKQDLIKLATENRHKISVIRSGMAAAYFDSNQQMWITGVIVGIRGKRVGLVIPSNEPGTYQLVPPQMLYVADDEPSSELYSRAARLRGS